MGQPLWKTVWKFLKKLKTELAHDPPVPFLGICPEELEEGTQTGICTLIFATALFTTAQRWEQLRCPLTDKWISTMWHIYTMEYNSALKRKEILTHTTTWMNLEDVMLSEISQSQKNKYCTTLLI